MRGEIYVKYLNGETSLLQTFNGKGIIKIPEYNLTRNVHSVAVIGKIYTNKTTSIGILFIPSYAEGTIPVYDS